MAQKKMRIFVKNRHFFRVRSFENGKIDAFYIKESWGKWKGVPARSDFSKGVLRILRVLRVCTLCAFKAKAKLKLS